MATPGRFNQGEGATWPTVGASGAGVTEGVVDSTVTDETRVGDQTRALARGERGGDIDRVADLKLFSDNGMITDEQKRELVFLDVGGVKAKQLKEIGLGIWGQLNGAEKEVFNEENPGSNDTKNPRAEYNKLFKYWQKVRFERILNKSGISGYIAYLDGVADYVKNEDYYHAMSVVDSYISERSEIKLLVRQSVKNLDSNTQRRINNFQKKRYGAMLKYFDVELKKDRLSEERKQELIAQKEELEKKLNSINTNEDSVIKKRIFSHDPAWLNKKVDEDLFTGAEKEYAIGENILRELGITLPNEDNIENFENEVELLLEKHKLDVIRFILKKKPDFLKRKNVRQAYNEGGINWLVDLYEIEVERDSRKRLEEIADSSAVTTTGDDVEKGLTNNGIPFADALKPIEDMYKSEKEYFDKKTENKWYQDIEARDLDEDQVRQYFEAIKAAIEFENEGKVIYKKAGALGRDRANFTIEEFEQLIRDPKVKKQIDIELLQILAHYDDQELWKKHVPDNIERILGVLGIVVEEERKEKMRLEGYETNDDGESAAVLSGDLETLEAIAVEDGKEIGQMRDRNEEKERGFNQSEEEKRAKEAIRKNKENFYNKIAPKLGIGLVRIGIVKQQLNRKQKAILFNLLQPNIQDELLGKNLTDKHEAIMKIVETDNFWKYVNIDSLKYKGKSDWEDAGRSYNYYEAESIRQRKRNRKNQ